VKPQVTGLKGPRGLSPARALRSFLSQISHRSSGIAHRSGYHSAAAALPNACAADAIPDAPECGRYVDGCTSTVCPSNAAASAGVTPSRCSQNANECRTECSVIAGTPAALPSARNRSEYHSGRTGCPSASTTTSPVSTYEHPAGAAQPPDAPTEPAERPPCPGASPPRVQTSAWPRSWSRRWCHPGRAPRDPERRTPRRPPGRRRTSGAPGRRRAGSCSTSAASSSSRRSRTRRSRG